MLSLMGINISPVRSYADITVCQVFCLLPQLITMNKLQLQDPGDDQDRPEEGQQVKGYDPVYYDFLNRPFLFSAVSF